MIAKVSSFRKHVAGVLVGVALAPANAAEREQVRIVVNLVAAVKMPYREPERESREDPAGLA